MAAESRAFTEQDRKDLIELGFDMTEIVTSRELIDEIWAAAVQGRIQESMEEKQKALERIALLCRALCALEDRREE